MTIAGTVDLRDAARREWDALVIGAGPSGSIAARGLALAGHSVLLVDKSRFPRWKVCGSSLNLRALSVLEHAGLGTLVRDRGGVPVNRLAVMCRGKRCSIPLPGGVTLSREAFDTALVEAAVKAGVQFLPQAAAALGDVTLLTREVRLRDGEAAVTASARTVIAASGLGSKLLTGAEEFTTVPAPGSRIGAGAIAASAPTPFEAGTIYMACGKAGYVGFARIEGGRLDIGAALDADAVRAHGGLAETVSDIVAEAGFDAMGDLSALEWRGTPALTRQTTRIGGHRLLVVGDAAGYVEPFTGEGMAWAMSGGAAAAELVAQALPGWNEGIETAWSAWHGRLVTERQLVCKGLSALLRHPRLTAAVVGTLALAPSLASPLVKQVNAAVTRARRSSV